MIQSMTGYGKASGEFQGKTISVEIRTLNSRQADISLRTPGAYREKELEIRNLLTEGLERGKIDCSIFTESAQEEAVAVINQEVVRNYFGQLKKIAGELYLDKDELLLPIIMRLPDVLKIERPELQADEWNRVSEILREAMVQVNRYREAEGKAMETDLKERIILIENLLERVIPFEQARSGKVRERIRKNFEEYLASLKLDENRFEQEIIFYLERMDFSEEKTRLAHHCRFFRETLAGNEAAGRKLTFISQEMGREINTLGSKASDADIQKIVVEMKDELEKIKEQLANIL